MQCRWFQQTSYPEWILIFSLWLSYTMPFLLYRLYVDANCSHEREFCTITLNTRGERGGSVVECRTLEREVGGSKPTAAVLCPWARHFTPGKYWLITQEAVALSRHDWKIVDWDVKPQHKTKKKLWILQSNFQLILGYTTIKFSAYPRFYNLPV